MGESLGDHKASLHKVNRDEEIMPYIDMANLACGFHAGDPVTIHKSIKEARLNGVNIGAHPSYPDLEGFGRREMQCSVEEIVSFVIYQCGALDALCQSYDTKISYVKPHGALYNTMMKDMEVFKAISKAMRFDWVSISCDAEGTLDKVERSIEFTGFKLSVKLVISAEADRKKAERLLHKAESICLITNSLKAESELTTEIIT